MTRLLARSGFHGTSWRGSRPARHGLAAALLLLSHHPVQAGQAWWADQMRARVWWDLGAAMPDGPGNEPAIRLLLAVPHEDASGHEAVLVCLTLEFRDPDAGRIGAVLSYGPDNRGRLRLLAPPFYHGLLWQRGSLPPADACAAAGMASWPVTSALELDQP